MPRDPYYGPGPWCPPWYVPYRYPPRPLYQYPPRYVPYRYALRRKSKAAAGLLGIFLGCFGFHNFYLGYTGRAVAQLLITLLSSQARRYRQLPAQPRWFAEIGRAHV